MANPLGAMMKSVSVAVGAVEGGVAAAGAAIAGSPIAQSALNLAGAVGGIAAAGATAAALRADQSDIAASRNKSSASTTRSSMTSLQKSQHPYHRVYIVNNFKGQDPVVIRAWMPEQISLDVGAQYAALFGQGLLTGDDAMSQAYKTFGFSGITREMSYKVWQSSSGLSMNLPLVFAQDDTPIELDGSEKPDIIGDLLKLKALCLPSVVTNQAGQRQQAGFLEPPGTSVRLQEQWLANGLGALSNGASEVSTAATNILTDKSLAPTFNAFASAIGNLAESMFEFQSWTSIYIGNFLYFDKVVVEQVGSTFDMQMDTDGKPMRATVNLQFTTLFDPTIQDMNAIFLR